MKFVDAHMHLSDAEYSGCVDEIMAEAKNSNVAVLVSNSMGLETSIRSLKLAQQYSGIVYAFLEMHPWNVNDLKKEERQQALEPVLRQVQDKALPSER